MQLTLLASPGQRCVTQSRQNGAIVVQHLGRRTWRKAMHKPSTSSRVQARPMICVTVAEHGNDGAATGKAIPVRFTLRREVEIGQSHVIVGDHHIVGGWKVKKGLHMNWTDGHVWQAEAEVAPGSSIEFKCVLLTAEGGSFWEEGANHKLHVPESGVVRMAVAIEWSGDMHVATEEAAPEPAPEPAAAAADEPQEQQGWESNGTHAETFAAAATASSGSYSEDEGDALVEGPSAASNGARPDMPLDVVELKRMLQEANASLNAERQFAQRMMESVRTLKQQVADLEASGKQQQEQDRRRIRQLESAERGSGGVAGSTSDVAELRRMLTEANAALDAEREFGQRMMAALRAVKQQVADNGASQLALERELRQERTRVSQLEDELAAAVAELEERRAEVSELAVMVSQASSALTELRGGVAAEPAGQGPELRASGSRSRW